MKIDRQRLLRGVAAAGLVAMMSPAITHAAPIQPTTDTVVIRQDLSGQSDEGFVMGAASSSITEILLGRLAVDHAASDEVRQFGQQMVVDHTKMLADASNLGFELGFEPPTTPMDRSKVDLIHYLATLQGTDFDAAYMQAMVTSQREAEDNFQAAANDRQGNVQAFAQAWLQTFQVHVAMAEQTASAVGVDPSSI
jgi:putative membrane protein